MGDLRTRLVFSCLLVFAICGPTAPLFAQTGAPAAQDIRIAEEFMKDRRIDIDSNRRVKCSPKVSLKDCQSAVNKYAPLLGLDLETLSSLTARFATQRRAWEIMRYDRFASSVWLQVELEKIQRTPGPLQVLQQFFSGGTFRNLGRREEFWERIRQAYLEDPIHVTTLHLAVTKALGFDSSSGVPANLVALCNEEPACQAWQRRMPLWGVLSKVCEQPLQIEARILSGRWKEEGIGQCWLETGAEAERMEQSPLAAQAYREILSTDFDVSEKLVLPPEKAKVEETVREEAIRREREAQYRTQRQALIETARKRHTEWTEGEAAQSIDSWFQAEVQREILALKRTRVRDRSAKFLKIVAATGEDPFMGLGTKQEALRRFRQVHPEGWWRLLTPIPPDLAHSIQLVVEQSVNQAVWVGFPSMLGGFILGNAAKAAIGALGLRLMGEKALENWELFVLLQSARGLAFLGGFSLGTAALESTIMMPGHGRSVWLDYWKRSFVYAVLGVTVGPVTATVKAIAGAAGLRPWIAVPLGVEAEVEVVKLITHLTETNSPRDFRAHLEEHLQLILMVLEFRGLGKVSKPAYENLTQRFSQLENRLRTEALAAKSRRRTERSTEAPVDEGRYWTEDGEPTQGARVQAIRELERVPAANGEKRVARLPPSDRRISAVPSPLTRLWSSLPAKGKAILVRDQIRPTPEKRWVVVKKLETGTELEALETKPPGEAYEGYVFKGEHGKEFVYVENFELHDGPHPVLLELRGSLEQPGVFSHGIFKLDTGTYYLSRRPTGEVVLDLSQLKPGTPEFDLALQKATQLNGHYETSNLTYNEVATLAEFCNGKIEGLYPRVLEANGQYMELEVRDLRPSWGALRSGKWAHELSWDEIVAFVELRNRMEKAGIYDHEINPVNVKRTGFIDPQILRFENTPNNQAELARIARARGVPEDRIPKFVERYFGDSAEHLKEHRDQTQEYLRILAASGALRPSIRRFMGNDELVAERRTKHTEEGKAVSEREGVDFGDVRNVVQILSIRPKVEIDTGSRKIHLDDLIEYEAKRAEENGEGSRSPSDAVAGLLTDIAVHVVKTGQDKTLSDEKPIQFERWDLNVVTSLKARHVAPTEDVGRWIPWKSSVIDAAIAAAENIGGLATDNVLQMVRHLLFKKGIQIGGRPLESLLLDAQRYLPEEKWTDVTKDLLVELTILAVKEGHTPPSDGGNLPIVPFDVSPRQGKIREVLERRPMASFFSGIGASVGDQVPGRRNFWNAWHDQREAGVVSAAEAKGISSSDVVAILKALWGNQVRSINDVPLDDYLEPKLGRGLERDGNLRKALVDIAVNVSQPGNRQTIEPNQKDVNLKVVPPDEPKGEPPKQPPPVPGPQAHAATGPSLAGRLNHLTPEQYEAHFRDRKVAWEARSPLPENVMNLFEVIFLGREWAKERRKRPELKGSTIKFGEFERKYKADLLKKRSIRDVQLTEEFQNFARKQIDGAAYLGLDMNQASLFVEVLEGMYQKLVMTGTLEGDPLVPKNDNAILHMVEIHKMYGNFGFVVASCVKSGDHGLLPGKIFGRLDRVAFRRWFEGVPPNRNAPQQLLIPGVQRDLFGLKYVPAREGDYRGFNKYRTIKTHPNSDLPLGMNRNFNSWSMEVNATKARVFKSRITKLSYGLLLVPGEPNIQGPETHSGGTRSSQGFVRTTIPKPVAHVRIGADGKIEILSGRLSDKTDEKAVLTNFFNSTVLFGRWRHFFGDRDPAAGHEHGYLHLVLTQKTWNHRFGFRPPTIHRYWTPVDFR